MKRIFILAALPLLCVSCFPTRIVTYTPTPTASYYTTSVTPPRSNTTTLVTQVNAKNPDISLHLDLQAVGALFSQSSNPQEFEQLLNSSSYPVSNLDLNNDGYIDYLRVLETVDGYNHVYLIQALLGADVYQDVATIVVERPGYSNYCCEIIGSPYIYGPSYIVRPTFIMRPLIFTHICRVGYHPWRSPWYWNHFPSYYRHHAPVFLNHYQSYVHTFMGSHRYCRQVTYPSAPHLPSYASIGRSDFRNDYGAQHPERSFTERNANTPRSDSGSGMVRNAYDIRQNAEATKITTTSVTGRGSAGSSTTTGRGTATASTTATPSVRSAGASTSTSTPSATSRSAASSSTTSRGTASTATTATRSASTSVSTPSTTSRSAASSSTTSRGTTSTSATTTRSTGTVSSSVRSSGSTTTVRSSSATSPRSNSTSSASRSSSSSSRSSSVSSSRSSSSSSSRSSSVSSSRSSSGSSSSRSSSATGRGSSTTSRGSR